VCCDTGVTRTEEQANALAAALDIDLDDVGVCWACLSFVSTALEGGDERDVRRTSARIARDLWAEGLALPVQVALERARRRELPDAEAAIAAVERAGPRAPIVQAIVRRLAADLTRRTREDLARLGLYSRRDAEVRALRPREADR
jgi:hypothetical protein